MADGTAVATEGVGDVPGLVEHLFRHESARLVSTLTRLLGVHNLDVAEEIVQETLLTALQAWPYHEIPRNPAAWLTRVAKNRALDLIRRERRRRRFAEQKPEWMLAATLDDAFDPEEIEDHQLRMMFACCHPRLPEESQIALTLRLLCGLSAAEIAAAFLTGEAAIQKRLFRAKERLRAADAAFEVPRGAELLARLDVMLAVLYLLFNEGYNSASHELPVRKDLCLEALRLALLLERRFGSREPQVAALVALMCLHSARISARIDERGSINLLADQDRRLWDRALIGRGLQYLAAASTGDALSRYHLEAGIAACHCTAESFERTDWGHILWLYDVLAERQPSPVVRLNRAIALGYARGPQAAIEALHALEGEPGLHGYYLFPATLGEFHVQAGERERAAGHFRRALELTAAEAERRLLRAKCEACTP